MIRYLPDEPLPAVPYVPGRTARPLDEDARSAESDPARLLLRGLDLFNHGCYWEAHEAWEERWHLEGRRGPDADLLKGLIALAAAGVKARQRNPAGVSHHARRARTLFAAVRAASGDDGAVRMGLSLSKLIADAETLARAPIIDEAPDVRPIAILPFRIDPD